MIMLNPVQKIAYEMIQYDARFLYTLTHVSGVLGSEKANIDSNYITMSMPYIACFADGAEQWINKIGIKGISFNDDERQYYELIRGSIKLFDLSYANLQRILHEKLVFHDKYFYEIRTLRSKITGKYYNVGTDVCSGSFCGNTILCSVYAPFYQFQESIGPYIRNMSEVAGRLAAFYGCKDQPIYKYDKSLLFTYKDYHFFDNCPLKKNMNNIDGLCLFSILCTINFLILFINNFFLDEFPSKLRFAYIQYYYLLDILDEINDTFFTNFHMNDQWQNQDFRNCMAHYGLGQILKPEDIIIDDLMGGLTQKIFGMDYMQIKNSIYSELQNLAYQIENYIF